MAVVNLDKVVGAHLESIQAPEVIKNGFFLQLGALVDGESSLRTATKVLDPTEGNIVLHATGEVDADPRKAGLKNFQVEAGEAGRGYHLVKGDQITLTVDLFASVPAIGEKVAPQANSFLLDTALDTESLILEVIQEKTLGYDNAQAFTVAVIKA